MSSTPPRSTPVATDDSANAVDRMPLLGLSVPQVAGSALAAVSGAFLAAWLGVAGTLVGVAIGSVVGTVGSASYAAWLQRTHSLVTRGLPREPSAEVARPRGRTPALRELPWRRLGVATVAVAALGLGTLTLLEAIAGEPVSTLAGGSGSGTTIGRALGQVGDDSGAPDRGDEDSPTGEPTEPTDQPTEQPTDPTDQPTDPTDQPTGEPTDQPTDQPTGEPTDQPTDPATPPTDPVTEPTPGAGATPVSP